MIKHLTPKTKTEIKDCILAMPSSIEKIKLLKDNYIELTKKETQDLLKNLNKSEKLQVGFYTKNKLLIKRAIREKLDLSGQTEVLWWGIQNNYIDIIKLVAKSGIDNRVLEKEYFLQHAIDKKQKNIIEILIESGVNIHIDNDTPLIELCNAQEFELMKLFVQNGANIHAQDDMCLITTCINGNLEIFKYLINNGANIHAQNELALRLACANGHIKIVKMLLDLGAEVNANNYLAYQWAILNDNTSEIKTLLEHYEKRLTKT